MKQLCDILGAETVDSIPYRLNEVLFYGDSDRDPIYRAICDMYANDLSYDWFYDFYQSVVRTTQGFETGLYAKIYFGCPVAYIFVRFSQNHL